MSDIESWLIVETETGEKVEHTKIYGSYRGARMGLSAFIKNQMQGIYLHDDSKDYGFYVAKVLENERSPFPFICDHPKGSEAWRELEKEYEQIKEELVEKYDVREAKVSFT